MLRDHKYLRSVCDFLRAHNLFTDDKIVSRIATGVEAVQDVTCDSAYSIGQRIMQNMLGLL
jgi:hypothetical protein